jgi:hypothetical protein
MHTHIRAHAQSPAHTHPLMSTRHCDVLQVVVAGPPGPSPKASDVCTVQYTGQLIDGSVFDSSVRRKLPLHPNSPAVSLPCQTLDRPSVHPPSCHGRCFAEPTVSLALPSFACASLQCHVCVGLCQLKSNNCNSHHCTATHNAISGHQRHSRPTV